MMAGVSSRTMKEVHALFVPWCAVMFLCTVPLLWDPVNPGGIQTILQTLGACIGIPLLASLSFGEEFDNQTLALLLSQPIDRMKIWQEKWRVTSVAVLLAVIPLYINFRISDRGSVQPRDFDWTLLTLALVWIVVTTCSATFWTLVSRSTLGGLCLNIAAGVGLLIVKICLDSLWEWSITQGYWNHAVAEGILNPRAFDSTSLKFYLVCALGYAGLMLWLGQRKLARFQTAGGFIGPDLLTARVVPRSLVAMFPYRSNPVILNVIRKELHLLKPLWWTSGVFIVVWIAMASWVPRSYAFLSRSGPQGFMFTVISVIFPLGAMILAGVVSLGEERTSGTHAWHLTLPMSSRLQWLIKLVLALAAGVVCAVVIPSMLWRLAETAFGAEFVSMWSPARFPNALPATILITLLSFWCASVVRGTTRAALLGIPLAAGLVLSYQAGHLFGLPGSPIAVPFKDWILFLVSRFQLNPENFSFRRLGIDRDNDMFFLLAPVLLLATFQSYRLFPRLAQDGFLRVTRLLLSLVLVTLLISSYLALDVYGYFDPTYTLTRNVGDAVFALYPDVTRLDAAHPVPFTVEDLRRAGRLLPDTEHWLRHSTMTVAAGGEYGVGKTTIIGDTRLVYDVKIHLAHGTTCTLSMFQSKFAKSPFIFSACK